MMAIQMLKNSYHFIASYVSVGLTTLDSNSLIVISATKKVSHYLA